MIPLFDTLAHSDYTNARTIGKETHVTDHSVTSPLIQVGDTVTYKLRTGEPVPTAQGKVIALFDTQCGDTLADIAWDWIGPPKRVNLMNLTKAMNPTKV